MFTTLQLLKLQNTLLVSIRRNFKIVTTPLQLLAQLQFSQLQFWLSHFALSVGVMLLTFNSDFIIFVLNDLIEQK